MLKNSEATKRDVKGTVLIVGILEQPLPAVDRYTVGRVPAN